MLSARDFTSLDTCFRNLLAGGVWVRSLPLRGDIPCGIGGRSPSGVPHQMIGASRNFLIGRINGFMCSDKSSEQLGRHDMMENGRRWPCSIVAEQILSREPVD
ncbi:hypothetical protein GWI33_001338 [Rhynchophorus ferrugineus]|uniref:Uncharacterized protein n=1 Tax=Rhynchophorus ferrugineus TaxID=354439 RepID=A0A834IZ72_RHYFE|nr:hypothetical protein GWI33_001338 [Rhynchophorus ferrugineus]